MEKHEICKVDIVDVQDVQDFRVKIFEGIKLLAGNEFVATRIATDFSIVMKRILSGVEKYALAGNIINEDKTPVFQIEISCIAPIPEKILNSNNYQIDRIADKIRHVLYKMDVFDTNLFQQLKNIFNSKTRNQLLREVQSRNKDLKKTLQELQYSQRQKEVAQQQALEKLQELNRVKAETNALLEKQVKERTHKIELQKNEIEEKNKDITDSIQYAQRIQNAILPEKHVVKELFPESFVFYQPKDIVSGDFYAVESFTDPETNEQIILFCVADCTGHGVPGAFMSLIGSHYLKLSYHDLDVRSPAGILEYINLGIQNTFKQTGEDRIRDGMDMVVCAYHMSQKLLRFAGAKNSLYVVKGQELVEYKGDKHPIGSHTEEELQPFTNHEILLEGGECLYLFSDGYADQFGGPFSKKFMVSQLKKMLTSICDLDMVEQKQIIEETFYAWKGKLEQVDDICVFGVRI